LLGRNSDLVKIGGKRESLSGLSYKLKKIDGVDDGIFYLLVIFFFHLSILYLQSVSLVNTGSAIIMIVTEDA
jgi:hypothetical protein